MLEGARDYLKKLFSEDILLNVLNTDIAFTNFHGGLNLFNDFKYCKNESSDINLISPNLFHYTYPSKNSLCLFYD